MLAVEQGGLREVGLLFYFLFFFFVLEQEAFFFSSLKMAVSMAVSRRDSLKTHTSLVDDPTGTVGAIQQVQAYHIHCPTATQIPSTITVHHAFTLTSGIIGAGGFT